MAKYPFLPQAKQHISELSVNLEELVELGVITYRAKERVNATFEIMTYFSEKPSKQLEIEIASFPVSVIIVAGVKDKILTERFALLEAQKIYTYLLHEKDEIIFNIAKFFDWKIEETKESPYQFTIHFTNYLKSASKGRLVHSPEWKLVNRRLQKGLVYVTRREVCRLLQEEVQGYIEDRAKEEVPKVPDNIQQVIDEIKSEFLKIKPHLTEFDTIVGKAAESEYPPCIKIFLDRVIKGQHLSHTERFTLVTYLIHQGVSTEGILNMFANVSDFRADKTRYQIEHLAGRKGSLTAYKPYNCSTLQTHGVCPNPKDPICRTIKNPLTYHRRIKPKENSINK